MFSRSSLHPSSNGPRRTVSAQLCDVALIPNWQPGKLLGTIVYSFPGLTRTRKRLRRLFESGLKEADTLDNQACIACTRVAEVDFQQNKRQQCRTSDPVVYAPTRPCRLIPSWPGRCGHHGVHRRLRYGTVEISRRRVCPGRVSGRVGWALVTYALTAEAKTLVHDADQCS